MKFANSPRSRFILLATASYALLALAWIFFTDELLNVFIDIDSLLWLSTIKGVFFVIATSAMFFLALRTVPPSETYGSSINWNSVNQALNPESRHSLFRYLFAIVITIVTLVLGNTINVQFESRPMLILFMFPITFSALLGGLGPGLISTIMTALALDYLAIPTIQSFRIANDYDLIQWLFLIANGVLVSLLSEVFRRSLAKVEFNRCLLDVVVSSASDAIFVKDIQGAYQLINTAAATIVGKTPEQILGHDDYFLFPDNIASELIAEDLAIMTNATIQEREQHITTFDGQELEFLINKGPIFNQTGQVVGLFGICRNITERKRFEKKLLLAANVFTHAREGIMITDKQGNIIDVNAAFSRITGYARDDVLGKNPRLLSSGYHDKSYYSQLWRVLNKQGFWEGEIWNRRKNGEIYAELLSIGSIKDVQGVIQQYVAIFSDITASKEHEKQLHYIAHYDRLTQLPNRMLLADCIHQAMAQAQQHKQILAVIYLDLDGFKSINDKYGQEIGNQLLIAVAIRIKETLRQGDTLARFGGDEFVAVLFGLESEQTSLPIINQMLDVVAQPFPLNNVTLMVSASIGVTFYPQHDYEEVSPDLLIRQADQAMYQAKLRGKNCYRIFDIAGDTGIRGHHELIVAIQQALRKGEFLLYYQPKVNMRTGCVFGAEALLRWQHPQRGLLTPALFMPPIEDQALAIEIGEWVIDTVLAQIELWRLNGFNLKVSVNMSACQLQQANFVDNLCVSLAKYPKLKPSSLELEILETSALEDLAHVTQIIQKCRAFGVMFAIDDFGTGYSSLTYLKHLPVTQIKVDQSFVRDMLDDPDDLAILEGVLAMSRAFRHQVIAEGVETVKHGKMLLELGCELAQGYGIARPMPAHELPAWAANWQIDPSWVNVKAIGQDNFPLLFATVEHRAWLGSIDRYINGFTETPPNLDENDCRLGSWLATAGPDYFTNEQVFYHIMQLHQALHKQAVDLVADYSLHTGEDLSHRLAELHHCCEQLLASLQTAQ